MMSRLRRKTKPAVRLCSAPPPILRPPLPPRAFGFFVVSSPGYFTCEYPAIFCAAKRQAQEKVAKRKEAEAAVEKARSKLDKAKTLLEEAKSLVTAYVVITRAVVTNTVHISEITSGRVIKLSSHGCSVFHGGRRELVRSGTAVDWFLTHFYRCSRRCCKAIVESFLEASWMCVLGFSARSKNKDRDSHAFSDSSPVHVAHSLFSALIEKWNGNHEQNLCTQTTS